MWSFVGRKFLRYMENTYGRWPRRRKAQALWFPSHPQEILRWLKHLGLGMSKSFPFFIDKHHAVFFEPIFYLFTLYMCYSWSVFTFCVSLLIFTIIILCYKFFKRDTHWLYWKNAHYDSPITLFMCTSLWESQCG